MSVENILAAVHWLGHDAFRIDAGKTIYIDPFKLETGDAADIALVTHEHFDHCSPEDIDKVRTDNTVIVTEKGKSMSGSSTRSSSPCWSHQRGGCLKNCAKWPERRVTGFASAR